MNFGTALKRGTATLGAAATLRLRGLVAGKASAASLTALAGIPLQRMTAWFAGVILLIAWASVAGVLQIKWTDAIDSEIRQNTNLALALEEQTLRVLAAVDQASLRMTEQVQAGKLEAADYVRFANETGLVPQILTQLSLIGVDGHFVASNIDPTGQRTGPVDLSEREHIKVHLHPARVHDAGRQLTADGLYVGKPVLGKVSDKWTIQLSRRVPGANGQTLGVVVASLNPDYFEKVYQGVGLGSSGGVTLLGEDQTVRARVIGGLPSGMGWQAAAPSGVGPSPGQTEGHYQRISRFDGVERVVGFRRVGNYPLYVLVATGADEALSAWRSTRNVALVLTGLFSVAVLGALVVFTSSVRRLETKNAELRASEIKANAANQAKSEFLAAMSHELRTPLTSILGFSELMAARLENPRHKEQAQLIHKAGEHLNALLTEILDMAKIEEGAMPINATPQQLRPLLENTQALFGVTAAGKKLRLDLEISDRVPTWLVCDGMRLKQILNNLLSNAVKFTVQGGVRIVLDADEQSVHFQVIDTGPGIPRALHQTVFERFRQANDRVSFEHGGTGLGLTLARALAELMGGRLTLASEEGHGACFTLTLPRVEPAPDATLG